MKFTLPRVALTSLALAACTVGYAQENVPIEFYRPLKNSVSIGVRMFGGNAKVGFSNLGNIPSGGGTLNGQHFYDNGSVLGPDGQSTIETDTTSYSATYGGTLAKEVIVNDTTTGNPQTRTRSWVERRAVTGGLRFQLINHVEYTDYQDGTKSYHTESIAREYVGFDTTANAGQTRYWSFNQVGQVKTDSGGNYLELSNFTITPTGGTAQAESDDGPGVELQFARIIKRYKRFEWGLNFSAGAAKINAKTRNVVRANLHTLSDRYRLGATDSFNNPVTAASFSNWYSNQNNYETLSAFPAVNPASPTDYTATEYAYVSENFKYIGDTSYRSDSSDAPVDVFGYWQVKGAYYLLRVGPIVRFPFAKKWTVTVGAGLAGAYSGTDFIADEYIVRDDLAAPLRIQERSEEKRFVSGYYADMNIERWLTVRTGFFVGYGFEKLGKYDQELYGRKAEIDLGTSKGFRFGIITRF